MSTSAQFPDIEGGGSLLLAWQLKDKRVLVVGGGKVAASRLTHLLTASALITIICPLSGCCPEVLHRIRTLPSRITHIDRIFSPSDIPLPIIPSLLPLPSTSPTSQPSTPSPNTNSNSSPRYAMVLSCIPSPSTSSKIYEICHERHVPVNIADVPPECDFYFGSTYRDGPVQVMVSTNGRGPRMANRMRLWIEECLGSKVGEEGIIGEAVEKVGRLRELLREMTERDKVEKGGVGDKEEREEGKKRMGWMIKVSDAYTWEDFCQMDGRDMRLLLQFYEKGEVPRLECLRAMEGEGDTFDGSFGFCVGCG